MIASGVVQALWAERSQLSQRIGDLFHVLHHLSDLLLQNLGQVEHFLRAAARSAPITFIASPCSFRSSPRISGG